jgi:hypothetical protein
MVPDAPAASATRGRAALEGGEVGGGGAGTDRQRQQHQGEAVRDLGGLGGHDRAARAVGEVRLELLVVAGPQVVAGVGAEPFDRPLTVRPVGDRLQVRLDPRLAQSSRARKASWATAVAFMPSSGAISAGFICSISVYQSTSCQRVGRLRNACA